MPHNNTGWISDPDTVDSVCESLTNGIFGAAAPHLLNEGKGKTVLLYESYKAIGMEFPVLNQGQVGTCTSFGIAGSVDTLKATEIKKGERSEFKNITATEPIYYGARKLNGWRINGDGASVALGVKYVGTFGTVARGKYNSVDLSNYSETRSRQWGNNSGFPKEIEEISKDYIIEQYARVTSYDMCRDSIASGYPVVIGSNQGFSNVCNNDGVAKASGSWGHCMFACGIRGDKDLVLIVNSWGPNWNRMPVRKFNEPKGSFWVEASVIDRMCKQDAWNLAAHKGYPKIINTEVAW
jgi:hypothetical protein